MRIRNNNKGFSLVELIVVIAIMAIAVGTLTLSVSLVTGSEAKKAFQKMESLIDEARTGAMSRYNQSLTVEYLAKDSSYDEGSGVATGDRDADGFFGVMNMSTIKPGTDPDKPVEENPIANVETRMLCKQNVELNVECTNAAGTVASKPIPADGTRLVFNFDRSTGLYSSIKVVAPAPSTTVLLNIEYDKVARQFKVDGGADDVNVFITAKSGIKEYKMQLIGETGKHVRID